MMLSLTSSLLVLALLSTCASGKEDTSSFSCRPKERGVSDDDLAWCLPKDYNKQKPDFATGVRCRFSYHYQCF